MSKTLRAAYADPPYLGCAVRHYGKLHPEAAAYDDPATHQRLITRLCDEFDTWALSLHEPSLRVILPMCPADTRVGVWVKPFASFKANVTRAWTWEPVIFRFARPRTRLQPTWRDFVSAPITLERGLTGAKPKAFCYWIFEGMNLTPEDDFTDLFPGSGAVQQAWRSWCQMKAGEPTQLELQGEGK